MTKQELIDELNNFRNMEFLRFLPNMNKIEYFRVRRVEFNIDPFGNIAVWYFEDLDLYVKFESNNDTFGKCYEVEPKTIIQYIKK
jgi:hypothetical protein